MERLSAVFDAASVGISVIDPNGIIVRVNPKLCELYGLPAESLIGKSTKELSYNLSQDPTWPYYEQTVQQKTHNPIRVEKRYKKYDKPGEYWWADIWISPIYYEDKNEVEYFVAVLIDITERKRVREELRQSQEHYQSLFDNLNTAAAVYKAVNDGEDFIFIDFNKAGERIESISRDALIGRSVLEVFPRVKEFGLFEIFQRVYKTGQSEFMPATEYKDGRIKGRWRENLVYKQPTGEIVALYLDVTERMVAESSLKESELKYRELVQNANSIILGMDSEARITFINEFGQTFFGYTEDELIGQSTLGTIVPRVESTGRDLALLIKNICDRPHDFEKNINENMDRSGKRFWVEWTNKAVFAEDGSLKGVFCIGSDITVRKQIEDALNTSEIRYRRLFEAAKDGILILDAYTGQVVDVNPFLCGLLGYTYDEVCSKKLWEVGLFGDIERSKSLFKELQQQEYVRYEDLKLEKKNGDTVEVEFVSNVYLVDHTKVVQCNIRDISQRKEIECALETSRLELLNIEAAKQQDLLDSARALNAGVAHELRTPMQAFLNIIEYIEDQMEEASPSCQNSFYVQAIKDSIEDAKAQLTYTELVLNSLSAFAKAGAVGEEHLINVVTELKTIMRTLRYTDKFKILKDEQFILNGEKEAFISINQIEFVQIITNLCKNSIESMQEQKDPLLQLVVSIVSGNVQISIIDNGGGIPEGVGNKIFEPYFSTKEVKEVYNQGLGLSIVKNIVFAYNGRISYKSVPGYTEFIVTFPCAKKMEKEN